MNQKDYELVLDSLPSMGIFIIREDNHEILYLNEKVKKAAGNAEVGMICHEIWSDFCSNCPFRDIGDKKECRSVQYNSLFGKTVDMVATRILWQGNIPALLITASPHAGVSGDTYSRILRVNLTTDTYEIVKTGEEEEREEGTDFSHMPFSRWIDWFIKAGNVHSGDVKRLLEIVQTENLSREIRNNRHIIVCPYRRKVEKGFRWHTLEIVPDYDYAEDNQTVMLYVKDIHDVYKKGIQLEEINIQNQEIIQSLGELNFGIYVIDMRTGMLNPVRVSQDMDKLFHEGIWGWDEVLVKMLPFFHPEYREPLLEKFSVASLKEALARGEKKIELLCQRMIEGRYHYVSVSVHFRESSIDSNYVVLAVQDVDERTRQEFQRSQDDRRMAVIIKSRYHIMSSVDLDTGMCDRVYLDATEDLADLQTVDYEKEVKKAVEEVICQDDAEKFMDNLSLEALQKKAESVKDYDEYICQYRIKKPSLCWIESQVFFIRQGENILVNILDRDITKEKKKEEAYTAEKRKGNNIINGLNRMFFATYYMDLETHKFFVLTQRDKIRELFGEEADAREAIHIYAENIVCEEDREEFLAIMTEENLKATLSGENPFFAAEYRIMGESEEDGIRWVRATVIMAEEKDGLPDKVLYVAQDVTESKQKEKREQQVLKEAYDAALHANASKSEFLSRMSHDIRTPMNAIIGMTAIAGTHLDNPARVQDCLNKITISGKHLLALINEVLDMSKIESGKIDLAEEEFNLSDLIHNLHTMILPSVKGKKQKLEIRIHKIEHEDVAGDVLRLQQVFMNILGNAVKYTPEGGELKLEITEKSSKTYGYGCYEFVFSDTGIGMSKEYMEKIFEPFSRAEDSRVSKIEGTGLGMTIAFNIVHMMNGDIRVESREGEGSRFTVTVFLKQQDNNMPAMEQLVDLPVLVVDDDSYVCEATCVMLEEMGMKGEWVLSGREAVARAGKAHETGNDFFAIILDWKMPEMDGIQTARKLRETVGDEVPIIILSAYDWSSIEEEAREVGIDGFISKPLFKSQLVYLFKKIVDGSKERETEITELSKQGYKNKRILLVEDNDLNREIAEEIIGDTGILVDSAADGKQALDKYQEMEPGYYDMIFMDIQMPVMNGYEATKEIRKTGREDAKTIPIIAMTANAFIEDVIASKEAGMNEHITKPLNVEQLMECIGRWVDNKPGNNE